MASTSIGPVSGIDYGTLINSLMQVEAQPITKLQNRVDTLSTKDNSFLSLSAKLTSLQLLGMNFASKGTFRKTAATTSDSTVLTATSGTGTATGSYTFTVKQLATSSQIASQGFSSKTTSLSELGTLPESSTNRRMDAPLLLSQLNGGKGVDSGSININMRDGSSVQVDLSDANTVQDVVDTINSATIGLSAAIQNDRIVITDSTGGSGTLTVTNVGGDTTATDLGLTGTASGNTLTGADVNQINMSTELSTLNGGSGVYSTGSSLSDFKITTSDGSTSKTYNVALKDCSTIEDVIDTINDATKDSSTGVSAVVATISADGHGITLVNTGSGTFSVTAMNSSTAAADLGIECTNASSYYKGDRLNSAMNSVLLSELNNGDGVDTSNPISITTRDGTVTSIDLSDCHTVNDVLNTLNASGANITASLNSSGNAFIITDNTGSTSSNLTISGVAATGLGIAGTVSANTLTGTNTNVIDGGSGTLYFSFGNQALNKSMKLADLNGGNGVSSGKIRITDSTGNSETIDLSSAVDIQDVVDAINNSSSLTVTASIGGQHGDQLVLSDYGAGSGTITVKNVGSTTTATDLGLTTPASNSSGVLTGTSLTKLNNSTDLDLLNGGLGVRTVSSNALSDFTITFGDSTTANVSLHDANTIEDVLEAINTAANVGGVQKLTASLDSDGHSIKLTSSDSSNFTLSANNGSYALTDLGLTSSASGGSLTGTRLISSLQSVQLSQLNGGSGVNTSGSLTVTNRAGVVSTVNISSCQTVQDIISAFNSQATGVKLAVNSAGNGLIATDNSGNTVGNFSISGTAASQLGLAQTVSSSTMNSGDINLRAMSENTEAGTLNGGQGFKTGSLKLTDSTGNSTTISLDNTKQLTLGDVITQINANATGIRASLNKNGDGILLTDSSGGTGTASVTEVNAAGTAASLGILGSFTGNTLSGTFTKSITVQGSDTLTTIVNKINAANFGVTASVIDDGSSTNPYRLSISSRYSGENGSIMFDGSSVGIQSNTLIQGQDAVVSYGTLNAVSSTNAIKSLVSGLTINAVSIGTATITVAQDTDTIVSSVQEFVDSYNDIMNNIATLTKFDSSDSNNNGVLFGNSVVRSIQNQLTSFITRTFKGVGSVTSLTACGFSFDTDTSNYDEENEESVVTSKCLIDFDSEKFLSMLEDYPDAMRELFTNKQSTTDTTSGGFSYIFSDVVDKFTDPVYGSIYTTTDSIEKQISQMNNRVNSLNDMLTNKRDRLIQQYANLETTIAKLQNQQSAISSLTSSSSSS